MDRAISASVGEATATRRGPVPKTISHSFGFWSWRSTAVPI
jgi:hypothetical protein